MRPRKFRLHFNRINMQRGNPNVWTVHFSDRCIQARSINVKVPLETIFNPQGRQPRAYLSGKGQVEITNEGVTIY